MYVGVADASRASAFDRWGQIVEICPIVIRVRIISRIEALVGTPGIRAHEDRAYAAAFFVTADIPCTVRRFLVRRAIRHRDYPDRRMRAKNP